MVATKKTSKERYERVFNELFGVTIQWRRLPIEDLERLAEIFHNPTELIERLTQVQGTSTKQAAISDYTSSAPSDSSTFSLDRKKRAGSDQVESTGKSKADLILDALADHFKVQLKVRGKRILSQFDGPIARRFKEVLGSKEEPSEEAEQP